ncbi:S8/S53 family peptidase [Microbacterium sp. AZCO]|uniref:S8 family peptidase n=1 Tax=Microbacterium sp. AZCO TaxID=3142976 RepID=UPI0031F3E2C8
MSDATKRATGDANGWRRVPRFSVLDPAGEPPHSVYSTVYVTDELLIDTAVVDEEALRSLRALAGTAGWRLEFEEDRRELAAFASRQTAPRSRGASTTVPVRLRAERTGERVAATPDAWALLREVRRSSWGKRGIGLNHVLSIDSLGVNPFKANPFKANPFKANPFKANPFKANGTVGIDSYAEPGFGGLQPVTYLGPAPLGPDPEAGPIVAIFDTGCGKHPWLEDAVNPLLASAAAISMPPDPRGNPDDEPSLAEPLDGIFDDAAGHGTFIAGIIRQKCPEALILPIRVADGEGVIIEDDLLGALGLLVEFMDDRAKEDPARPNVSVLNLSFSYYHETPDDPDTVSEMAKLLDDVRSRGCVVVCSAGNDATARPTYPAAIPATDPGRHVSVGALNPSDRSVALFSNIGDWVRVYAPGVSVMSTLPIGFEGGLQSGTSNPELGLLRQTLDADDFRGGFGVWSGTSFAAPVVAGLVAARIAAGESPEAATASVVKELEEEDQSRMG